MKRTIGHDVIFAFLSIELLISFLVQEYLFHQIAFFFFVFFLLTLYHLGKTLILMEAILFFAILQWLVTPLVFYYYFDSLILMPTPEEKYFQITFPATILMGMGFFFPFFNSNYRPTLNFKKSIIGLLLLLVGLVAYFIRPLAPSVLSNLFYVLSQLIYIGFFYSYFSKSSFRWHSLFIVIAVTILGIAREGMFATPILWVFFFSIFYFIQTKRKLFFKLVIGGTAIFVVMVIQSLKMDYRRATWSDGGIAKTADISLLGNLFWERVSNPDLIFAEESIFEMIHRLNQGYIISQTINHVPRFEPFAKGETVIEGIASSLVPRLLWPNKPKAGGGEMYPRFTGRELPGRTSMNISPMGEAYVNFGKSGGMVFMFFYGLFMKFSFTMCLKKTKQNPFFIFWIPLIFFASIFLGTDLNSILNTMVKGVMFTWIIYWFFVFSVKIKIF